MRRCRTFPVTLGAAYLLGGWMGPLPLLHANAQENPSSTVYTLYRNLDLTDYSASSSDGIITSTFSEGGNVSVVVEAVDGLNPTRNLPIYRIHADHASTDGEPVLQHETEEIETDTALVANPPDQTAKFTTLTQDGNDMAALLQSVGMDQNIVRHSLIDCSISINTKMNIPDYRDLQEVDTGCRARTEFDYLPVTITITVTGATLTSVKIPGIGTLEGTELTDASSWFAGKVHVNGTLWRHLICDPDQPNSDLVFDLGNLPVGTKIKFTVPSSYAAGQNNQRFKPKIIGIPDIEILRFAGDLYYYVDSSVRPGWPRPFVGFDSVVHGVALRSHPENFQVNSPDWIYSPTHNTYTFSHQLKLVMDKDVTEYQQMHQWCKTKFQSLRNVPQGATPCTHPELVATNTVQRNNQREGLNMELLYEWKNWVESGSADSRFVAGLDPDEILHITDQDGNKKYFKMGDNVLDPWKTTPEASKVPLDEMINSYIAYRMVNFDGAYEPYVQSQINTTDTNYRRFELQDIGTSPSNPNGTGGHNPLPGRISIKHGARLINLKLSTFPLLNNSDISKTGFYGPVSGPTWPSWGEQNVSYTLHGINPLLKNQYAVALHQENSVGHLSVQYHRLADDPAGQASVDLDGTWTFSFNMTGYGYADITAYFDGYDGPVMIAGKELKKISLRFLGEQNILHEGRGPGAYLYLTDYYDSISSFVNSEGVPRFTRYVSKYAGRYVFQRGSETLMQIMDADPHTFNLISGREWYLSERAKAKQIPNSILIGDDTTPGALITQITHIVSTSDESQNPIVATYYGNQVSHTWNTTGTFHMRTTYRDYALTYEVEVVDYSTTESGLVRQGSIGVRNMSQEEASWLDVTSSDYKVAFVKNLLSSFTHDEGLRADHWANPLTVNRFEPSNNFSGLFKWYLDQVLISTPIPAQSFMASPSSDSDPDPTGQEEWFPHDWIWHFSERPLPPGFEDPDGIVNDINDPSLATILNARFNADPRAPDVKSRTPTPYRHEQWQIRYPWIAMTDQLGPMIRGNIKAIYNIKNMFSDTYGAFTGYSDRLRTSPVLRLITDEQKRKLFFFRKMINGEYVVIPSELTGSLKLVNTTSPSEGTDVEYVHQCQIRSGVVSADDCG